MQEIKPAARFHGQLIDRSRGRPGLGGAPSSRELMEQVPEWTEFIKSVTGWERVEHGTLTLDHVQPLPLPTLGSIVCLGIEPEGLFDEYRPSYGRLMRHRGTRRFYGALARAGAGVTPDGRLRVSVTHRVPAKVMGSGLGRNHVYKGDYDIQLFDEQVVAEHNLETLRFGDIVAIIDADHTYGRIYRTGAVSIGVVVHSRSWTAGHGPGVTTLFSSKEGKIETVIDPNANLARLLGIR